MKILTNRQWLWTRTIGVLMTPVKYKVVGTDFTPFSLKT